MKEHLIRKIFGIIVFLFVFSSLFAKDFVVTNFGVKPDGITINTTSLQSLIDRVNIKGGGRIVFPEGKFLTGCLHLKSKVELHFQVGAVLLGSTDPFQYFELKPTSKQLSERKDNSNLALIVANGADHISITGRGSIDGQGLALALNADSLHHTGVYLDKNYNYRRMRPSELVRPKLLYIESCKNVRIDSLTIRNSACWGLSFDLCSDLSLTNLTVHNRAYWNNDGIDITDCKNVRIIGCNVNSADDGICLKSYHADSFNDSVYIANCEIRSSASAIKFGTASYGGFKNISIDHIKVFDTFRSAIAIESVDGGDIENVQIHDIVARNTGNPVFIRLGQRAGNKLGSIRNIVISDIDVEVPFDRPDIDYDLRGPEVDFFHNPFSSSICGIPGNYIEKLHMENIKIVYPGRSSRGMGYSPLSRLNDIPEQIKEYPEFSMFGELPAWAFYVRHVNGLSIKNMILILKDDDFRPAFVFDDVKNFSIKDCSLPSYKKTGQFVLKNCEDYDVSPKSQIMEIR